MPTFNRIVKWARKLLSRGANRDVRPELLADGYYADGFNIRPASIDGNEGAVEAIRGEKLIYTLDVPNPSEWVCIGAAEVNGRMMDFWCHPDKPNNPSIVAIDGNIVAQSPGIPYTHDRPLQIAVVEACGSGVVYPADHQSPPLFWSIDDLINPPDATTYFEGYTTEINQVALSAPPQFPRHTANVDIGTGLPPGQYSYALRYEAPSGDFTNIGPETPLISVGIQHDFTWNNTAWPGARTTGGATDLTTPTRYGIELQFRIDNSQGFSFVEILRRAFNDGQGLNGPGKLSVVGRIPIAPGENRIATFVDPQDSNATEPITPDQEADRAIDIDAPKSVEFADNRLSYLNFSTTTVDTGITFREEGGSALFPVTSKVTSFVEDGSGGFIEVNSGYTDPVNDTYKRSYMRGEKYGFAIQPWSGNLNKSFAVPVPGSEPSGGGYQMPNRRDRKTGSSRNDANGYSDSPIYAALTDCQSNSPVDQSFDAFTQGDYRKGDSGRTINVLASAGSYSPWRPVGPDDTNIWGHQISPIDGVNVLGAEIPNSSYSPNGGRVFNPQHNALGIGIYGVENIHNAIKALSVVRTSPAGRVICQGIGVYRLKTSGLGVPNTGKDWRELDFLSRDLQLGLVPQNIIEDIIANPTNYEIQFVSPLGFYSELYSYYRRNPNFGGADGGDLLSYAGIQHDEGQVNTGEPQPSPDGPGMAYQALPSSGAPPGNYVGYSAWRNNRPATGQSPDPSTSPVAWSYWNVVDATGNANDGNSTMTLLSFQEEVTGRSGKYVLQTNDWIYPRGAIQGGPFQSDFTRRFHEPFYVVNIVKRGAEIPGNAVEYVNTGTTVMMESCVGISNGSPGQTFNLLNERIDDVLGRNPSDLRYVYVKPPGQSIQAWVCYTGASFNSNDADQSIATTGSWTAPDGTIVSGLYSAVRPNGSFAGRLGSISFDYPALAPPPVGSKILVRYNNESPILAFGGDVTISPSTHAVWDYSLGTAEPTTQELNPGPIRGIIGTPLPYLGWRKNSFYEILESFQNALPDNYECDRLNSIRQWCVMYDCETRAHSIFDLFNKSTFDGGSMVRSIYTPMPYCGLGSPAGPWAQYYVDYPWVPENIFYGGIRFLTNGADFNRDYWKQPIPYSVAIPEEGSDIRTDFCNAVAASLERDPARNLSPGARTFLSSNIYYLSEENGEGKVLASILGPNGQNMYVLTQSGVCRILTNKNILTGSDGAIIGTQSVSNYWADQMWISRDVGCPDQMWMLFSKGYAPVSNGQRADSFFWADRNGFYRLIGDSIIDLSRGKYLNVLKPTLKYFPTGYQTMARGFYNRKYNEAWFSIDAQVVAPDPPSVPNLVTLPSRLFVYSAQNGEWIGQYGYEFDKYNMLASDIWGKRDGESYLLDNGYIMSGGTRTASITVPLVGDMGIRKEFTRWAVTGSKPDQVEILDKNYNVICRQDEAIAALFNPSEAPFWTLLYSKGWEQWAPAVNIVNGVYAPTDVRPQDELFYLRCTWNTEGEKYCVALAGGFQNLK